MTEPSQYFKGRTVQEQMNEVIGYVDTRSAEVAVNAIASDVAQVHQDMLDADADASAAAASAAAAAGTLANAVKKTGEASQSIAGDIAVSGDLSAGGDLGVTGDAGVQGQLSVLGGCDLRSTVKVPTVATGTFDDNAANGTKVKNELDNYDAMVRNTGNMPIMGDKFFSSTVFRLTNFNMTAASNLVELFRFNPVTGQDNRMLIAIGDYVTVKFGTLPIQPDSDGTTITLKTIVTSATVMGTDTFDVGATYGSDGKIIVTAKANSNCAMWFALLSIHTGSRFPISNVDFSHTGETFTGAQTVKVTI